MKKIEDKYLGDGVYASYNGYAIVLDLRDQEPTLPYTIIVLEPLVLQALDDYKKLIQENS